ncbi:MATE family efflux transporter [Armatimonas rosea]|uniref:Probable multidrug resistance protein NorM n=1 Tax=Armatimonas rosea TaxID=685828 RepID=A0A7W9SMK4_ARMRO|nr:MATE family efflux transporter [Armatimonas rosea]MBB6048713.1 putative MATE family efflux protein [Armatimonas rosea]
MTKDTRQGLILEGPLAKGVFLVAMPSVAMMLVQTFNGFLDRFFVSKLGPEAIAAVTICTSWMWLILAAAMAVSTGTTALVGRFIGAGKTGDSEHAARSLHDAASATRQSIVLSLLISVVVGGILIAFRHPLMVLQGLDAHALPLAEPYLLVLALGQPVQFLVMILGGVFRGLGDTTRPFYVTLGSVAVHAVGNAILIPRIGIVGGALALIASQVLALALTVYFLRRSPVAAGLGGPWRLDTTWAWRILKIGLLAALQQLIRVGSMLVFQGMLARSAAGSAAVAALGVGLLFESIAFMPGFGYSIASSAFVGQNLGAGNVKRANAGAWAATWQAIAVMSVMGVVCYVFAQPFAQIFLQHGTDSAQNDRADETLRLAVAYLKIAALSEPFLALGMGLVGALQGAGETLSPTLLTAVAMIVVRLPLAWYLLNHFGLNGAWWAMSLSTMLQGVLVVIVFRQGRWRTVRV